jgi:hypothetical protein
MLKRYLVLSLLIIILNVSFIFAENLELGFKEFGIFSGFMRGDLDQKDDYEVVPLIMRFGFDLRPLLKNKSNNLIEFMIEPFINTVISPDPNLESGCSFLLKFAPALKEKFYPYIEGGLGMVHLTQQTREQATQFNFNETVGIGMTYFLKKNLTLNLGYRYRHISNASIKRPNKGIDTNLFICGVSILY